MRKFKHKPTGKVAAIIGLYYHIEGEPSQLPDWLLENSNDWEEIIEIKVPEYIECTTNYSNQFTQGKVYIADTKRTNKFGDYFVLEDDTKQPNGWGKIYFKPSTKEAYDAQFKEYEILSFRNRNQGAIFDKASDRLFTSCGKCDTGTVSEQSLLKNKIMDIHSIKRLSDNSIFTIGDICNRGLKLTSFDVGKGANTNTLYCSSNDNLNKGSWGVWLKDLEKQSSLFTTYDGVDIFEGDKFWFLGKYASNPTIICEIANKADSHGMDTEVFIYFSTKQAAEKYIAKNKVLFVTEDGIEITNKDKGRIVYQAWTSQTCQNKNFYETIREFEVNLNTFYENAQRENKRMGILYFSTRERAEEFLDMNKPQYSKQQLIKLLRGFDKETNDYDSGKDNEYIEFIERLI